MQKYRIPFFNYDGERLEIIISAKDYSGETVELRAAPSAFVVTGDDEAGGARQGQQGSGLQA